MQTINIEGFGPMNFPDDMSREDIKSAIDNEIYPKLQLEKIKPDTGFAGAFKSSLEQMKGQAALTAGKIGLMDEDAAEEYHKQQEEIAKRKFKPTEEGWLEAPVTKFKELLGGSLPYVAAPVLAGAATLALPEAIAAAPFLGGAAGIGGALGIGTAGAAAATGAATLASAAQFTGSNLARQMEEGKTLKDTSLANAALSSVPQALLDTVSFKMTPGIRKLFGSVGKEISEETAEKIAKQGLLATTGRIALAGGKTAAIEGTTEAAQQVFERLQAGLNLTDEKARQEYFDNFLGGAVLGTVLGGFGHAFDKAEPKALGQETEETEQTSPPPPYNMQPGAAMAGPNLLQLPAPDEHYVTPLSNDPLLNPLGNFTKQEAPEIHDYINQYRTSVGKPKLPNAFSIEDIADAGAPQQALDSLVANKVGYNGEKVTTQDVLNRAQQKNVDSTTVGFRDFLRRATGSEDINTLSPPQLFAAAKALDALKPGKEQRILASGTNALHYTPDQYNKAINGVKFTFGEFDNKPLGRQAILSEIKDFTGLKQDKDAQRILDKAVEDGHLQRSIEERNVGGKKQNVESFTLGEKATPLPAGMDIREEAFKRGKVPEAFDLKTGDTTLSTHENEEDAAKAKAQHEADRLSELKSRQKEVDKLNKDIETRKRKLVRLQSTEKGDTFEFFTKSAEADAKNKEDQARINSIKEEQAGFAQPIDIVPRGEKPKEIKTQHVLYENDQPIAKFGDQYQAERHGISRLDDKTLEQIVASAPHQKGTLAKRYAKLAENELASRKNPELNNGVSTRKGLEGMEGRLAALGQKVSPRLEESLEKLRQQLLPMLKKFGLEKVGLRIVESIREGNADGVYTKNLITLAMSGDNPLGVLRHESIHALKAMGAFTDAEWKTLQRMAKNEWIKKFIGTDQRKAYAQQYIDSYHNMNGFEEYLQEEAIAEAFKHFAGAAKPPAGMIANMMHRLNNMFRAIKNALTGQGFKTADEIFTGIEEGEYHPGKGTDTADKYSLVDWKERESRERAEREAEKNGTEAGRLQDRGRVSRSEGRIPGEGGVPAKAETLKGMPTEIPVPGMGIVKFGAFQKAVDAAKAYMRGKQYNPPLKYAKVDPARAKRIAAAFEAMEHNPDNPEVKASYNAMIDETLAQYQEIKKTGLKVDFITEEMGDPYKASPRLAILDAVNNNHLWVFPTDFGFGESNPNLNEMDNPMLRYTNEYVGKQRMRANDIFRVVHDYFGHIKDGVGFRADGEENAWRSHVEMYSPLARPAMTAETRGQNSWVNFGPHAEYNKTATAADTKYAPQKVGLLPEEFVNDGRPKQTDYGDLNEPKYSFKSFQSAFRPSARSDGGISFNARKQDATTFSGTHYGNIKTNTLTGSKYGTGLRGAERRRLDQSDDPRIRNRVYFYIEKPDGEMPNKESGVGGHVYTQTFSNILGPGVEMDRIRQATKGEPNAFESAVIDAGYDGYGLPGSGMMVVLNQDVPVNYEGTVAELQPRFSFPNAPKNRYTKTSEVKTAGKAIRDTVDSINANIQDDSYWTSLRNAWVDSTSGLAQSLKSLPLFDSKGKLRADMLIHAKNQMINLIKNGLQSGHIVVNDDGSLIVRPSENNLARSLILADKLDNNDMVKQSGLSGRDYIAEVARALRGKDIMAEDTGLRQHGVQQLAQSKALRQQAKGETGRAREKTIKHAYRLHNLGKKNAKMNREVQIKPEDIAWAEKQYKQNPAVKEILDIWKDVNDSLITLWEKTGLLNADDAAKYRNKDHYVPLFASREDLEEDAFFKAGTGAKTTRKLKQLEGSKYIRNVWENLDKHYAAMTASAYENQTRRVAVSQLVDLGLATESHANDKRVNLRFKQNGKVVNAILENPNDLAAFQMMNQPLNPIMKAFGFSTKVLRAGALLNPMYWIKQLVRDPLHASLVANSGIVTPFHSARAFLEILANNSEEAKILAQRGVIGSVDSTVSIHEFLNEVGKEKTSPSHLNGMLHRVMQIHEASDAATRVEIYKKAYAKGISKGMNKNQATDFAVHKARESINFSTRGNSPILHQLRQMIPFLSASITSLDTVYRAATGYGLNPAEKAEAQRIFRRRAMMMVAMATAYAMMYQDDEEYKKLPDYVKDNNWLIPAPGGKGFIKVPTPFEVGFLFKSIPEMGIRYMAGNSTGKEVLMAFKAGLIQNLPAGGIPIPQAGKPILESMANYSFFTGRPIEGMSDQGLPVANRGARASEFAKTMSAYGLDKISMSPAKIDNLIQGYAAELGVFTTSMADQVIYAVEGKTPPSKNLENMPFMKSFMTDPNVSKAVSDFYDIESKAKQTSQAFTDLKNKGLGKEAKEYIADEEHKNLIQASPTLRKIGQQMTEIRKQMNIVTENQDIPADVRRERLNNLNQQFNKVAAQSYKITESLGLR
jgi:hypothetical protein